MHTPNTDPENLPRLLTVEEVAALARLSKRTIYNRRCMGLPPQPIKVAGRLRFPVEVIERWLRGELPDHAAGDAS